MLYLLGACVFHGDVPAPVSALANVAVPAVLTFATAWLTNTYRAPAGAWPR